jgi:hypothetical protein
MTVSAHRRKRGIREPIVLSISGVRLCAFVAQRLYIRRYLPQRL